MMITAESPISALRGVGPKKAAAFEKLGVNTVGDLVTLFPRRYEDRTRFTPIALAMPGDTVCIRAMVAAPPRLNRIRRGMELVKLRAVDDTGAVEITYFNQSYRKGLPASGGDLYFLRKSRPRRAEKDADEPGGRARGPRGHARERDGADHADLSPERGADAARDARHGAHRARSLRDDLPNALPEEILNQYGLAQAGFAYENIHFPADLGALELARRRLIFEELFVLSCAMGRMRGERSRTGGLKMERQDAQEFFRTLPFTPTGAQERAVLSAADDMCSGALMNRLIQGDVGSGKTMIAAACVWYVWKNGYQSAFMAPTEILAEQHEKTLKGFLEPLGLRVGAADRLHDRKAEARRL